jgi:hypothetical protein
LSKKCWRKRREKRENRFSFVIVEKVILRKWLREWSWELWESDYERVILWELILQRMMFSEKKLWELGLELFC